MDLANLHNDRNKKRRRKGCEGRVVVDGGCWEIHHRRMVARARRRHVASGPSRRPLWAPGGSPMMSIPWSMTDRPATAAGLRYYSYSRERNSRLPCFRKLFAVYSWYQKSNQVPFFSKNSVGSINALRYGGPRARLGQFSDITNLNFSKNP